MAKEGGLGFSCAVDDSGGVARTISNDITNLTINTPRGEQDITGIDKSARERLLLLADVTVALNGVFNVAANMSHDVLKTIPSSSVARALSMTVAAKVMAANVFCSDYSLTRAANGAMTWSSPFALADGAVPTWA